MSNRSEGGRYSRTQGDGTFRRFPRVGWLALAAALALTAAGCSSSTSSSTSSSSSASSGSSPAASASVPAVSIDSFTVNIASTMTQFKALATAGTKGASSLQVGVVLPDTTSSTRWVDFDQPYLKQAFNDAGFTSSEYRIDNAQGSDATQLNDATADINLGAKILIVCPLDGPTGVAIAKLAEQKGVTLIAYDRAIFEGTKTYYVSFDNEHVGELIGTGFNSCVQSWGIKSPKVFVLNGGEDTDPNAISFASGYNKIVWGQAAKSVGAGAKNSAGDTLVGENFAPGWDNTKGGTIFQQEYTAHPSINATIEANDGLANSVITVLKAAGVKPKTVPTTGQDATAQGMAWILEGYQCGSVYKAVYKEAQDSVALATILLAGQTPPSALLNGTTVDPANSSITEPASLLTPVWVTAANMESTVVKDGFDTASAICAIAGASACSAAGIS
ncbi:MAG TPA: substrate-binding domain-containing protein [Streptosporangiaceae bacterium]|nr:substrate-binding domain-containing protein [Streptosporangiaceae bacterium]